MQPPEQKENSQEESKILELISEEWENAQRYVHLLRDQPTVLPGNTLDLRGAFALVNRPLVCVDEGIPWGIHLAGSGVLIKDPELRAKEIRTAGVEVFTTHDNCGAFKIAFPNALRPNASCREWGQAEAKRLGLQHRHITTEEMKRPKDLHFAVVIYYDGTGRFNPTKKMPHGFVVSRKYFSSAPKDLELCLKIALGKHGFGDHFSAETPLHIIAIADPADRELTLETLLKEARTAAKEHGLPRVMVHGMNMRF